MANLWMSIRKWWARRKIKRYLANIAPWDALNDDGTYKFEDGPIWNRYWAWQASNAP